MLTSLARQKHLHRILTDGQYFGKVVVLAYITAIKGFREVSGINVDDEQPLLSKLRFWNMRTCR